MTLDLTRRWDCVWDRALRPVGEGEWDKEPFDAWWARCGDSLRNLDPRIAEQWIHRHWSRSYMAFLEITPITWRLESWLGDRILSDVHLEFGGPMDAEHDYNAFNHRGLGPNATARAMNRGTWDIPLLALETPNGITSASAELSEVRYVVTEGSKRMRYLNALRHRGQGEGPHEIFILSTPQAL